jgi:hypothetical protein
VNDTPRHVLCNLIQKYGTSLYDDRGRCSGLLHDFCGAHKAEIAVLLTALEETVPLALITQSKTTSPRMLIGRLVKRLQDDRHLTDEAARWAVESWALALGIIQSTDVSQPKSKPNPPSSRGDGTGPKPLSESPINLPDPDPQSNSSRERKKGKSWGIRLITLMFTILAAIFVIALKNKYDDNERARLEANAESERQAKQEAAEQAAEEAKNREEAEQQAQEERKLRLTNPIKSGQTWVGYYFCLQQKTYFMITIDSVTTEYFVDGVFKMLNAEYKINGRYDPITRILKLLPGEWLIKPPGIYSVGLSGQITLNGMMYKGKITDPNCGEFILALPM